MIKLIERHVSKLAIAVLAGGICLAHPVYAADAAATNTTSGATMKHQDGQDHVATRLTSLHDKLKITAAQETQWKAVADVIRENEAAIHVLVEARHANENASAIDDLKSYKEIADAHAAGLAKLIPVFEDLYNTMSDKQKENADSLFSKYEGHEGHKSKAAK